MKKSNNDALITEYLQKISLKNCHLNSEHKNG